MDETKISNEEVINIKTIEAKKRKRIKRIKTAIITIILILFLLPTLLCIILGIRLSRLQNQVDDLLSTYSSKTEAKKQIKNNDQYAYASETTNHYKDDNNSIASHDITNKDEYPCTEEDKADEADKELDCSSNFQDKDEVKTSESLAKNTDKNTEKNTVDDSIRENYRDNEIDLDDNYEEIGLNNVSIDKKNNNTINSNESIPGIKGETENDEEPTEPAEHREADGIYYDKKVYLTFDDGPTKNTDLILDILAEYDVKATFFVIGQEDEESKERYRRIVDEGHSLGIHSYSHDYNKIYKSLEEFDKDFTKLWNLLYDTTGYIPTIYRFPGGSLNFVKKSKMQDFIRYINEKGMTYYDWNVVNGDAENIDYTEEQMIDYVLNGVARKKTSIVLMHDGLGKKKTVDTLPIILEALISGGAEVLPLDENAPLIQQIKATSVK